VAHYTTPTNIGMFLVSTLSAYDLGYLGLVELVLRLRSTFESMDKLEHYRGHLLNWYDSQTLTALPPRYISTVDSGNLAACLITLRQACLTMTNESLMGGKRWQGCLPSWIFWQKYWKLLRRTTRILPLNHLKKS
jgi:cyclic beta-1,2-glucan synthetase